MLPDDKSAGAQWSSVDFEDFERNGGVFVRACARILVKIRSGCDALFGMFLDLIFPRAELVAEIEAMDKTAFIRAAFNENAGKTSKEHTDRKFGIFLGTGTFLPTHAAIALFPYRNRYVREAVWQVKYRGNRKIAVLFSSCLTDVIQRIYMENQDTKNQSENPSIILPIPISAERRRERGYNQIELVLEQLSPTFQIRTDLLKKIRHTTPQRIATYRSARLHNLAGCFQVNRPDEIAGRTIVLIDDVLTTGATFAEARATLMEAGAKKVIAVALAH